MEVSLGEKSSLREKISPERLNKENDAVLLTHRLHNPVHRCSVALATFHGDDALAKQWRESVAHLACGKSGIGCQYVHGDTATCRGECLVDPGYVLAQGLEVDQ